MYMLHNNRVTVLFLVRGSLK